MKNIFKKALNITIICSILVLSSCEKDLYEDSIKNSKGKINYKTIDELPFLIPSVQKFNKDYKYLSYSKEATNKDALNLNLDLDHILEYVKENGLKTYSIVIKKEFNEYDNKYFENLHIFEKDGVYENVIFKYDALDDFKKFDPQTFTGDVEIYDINYVYQGVIQYEEGVQKCIKMAVGCMNVWWFTDIGEIWIWYECLGSGGGIETGGGTVPGGGTESGGTAPGSPGTTPGGGSTGSNNGGTTPPGSDPTSVDHVPVVANVPVLPDPEGITTFTAAFELTKELILSSEERLWLRNNDEATHEIYTYLWEILYDGNSENDYTEKIFLKEVITLMRQNPTLYTSAKPLIIEKKIDDSQLDDCTKKILKKLKQNHTIAKIIARFDSPQSMFMLNFSRVPNLVNEDGHIAYGRTLPTNNDYSYNIQLNSNYFKDDGATNLGKATTIIHEILHALIMSVIKNQGNPNNTDMTDYPEIWNEYVVLKTLADNTCTHETIGNFYTSIMAQALQEYITDTVPATAPFDPIYNELSWSGLLRSNQPSPFDTFLTPEFRAQVSNRKHSEMYNNNESGIEPSNNPPCLPN